jgi:hypothetical protein
VECVSFVREVHDWEVDVFASFFQRDLFKVKSFFSSLACSEGSLFPLEECIADSGSFKGGFFPWSAALVDNLRKRRVVIVD